MIAGPSRSYRRRWLGLGAVAAVLGLVAACGSTLEGSPRVALPSTAAGSGPTTGPDNTNSAASAESSAAVSTDATASTAVPVSPAPVSPAPVSTAPVSTAPVTTVLTSTRPTSGPPTTSPAVSSGPVDLTTGAASTTIEPPGTIAAGTTPARPTRSGPAQLDINGALPGGVDQVARDSIADVTAYWGQVSPEVFGKALPPLEGGYYSIDPSAQPVKAPCLGKPSDVKNNAFYCPGDDAIVYDRVYLARIAGDYSDLDVALTFAHEFGHVLQDRFPQKGATRSIALETQADCYAGAWAKWVTDGKAPHFSFGGANLDRVLGDYVWEMGDPAGTDPNHRQAHGSVFDRVTAMQEGYLDGPQACVTDFSDQRVFVAQKFTAENASTDGQGNVTLRVAIEQGTDLLKGFWTGVLSSAGTTFTAPAIKTDDRSCLGDHIVAVCADAAEIDLDPVPSLATYHQKIGDFATVTAMSLAYADWVLGKYGADNTVPARICATGAFAAYLYLESPPVLSPGDLDEAVRLLLVAGPDNKLVDTGKVSAWDRLDAFREGVLGGIARCGITVH